MKRRPQRSAARRSNNIARISSVRSNPSELLNTFTFPLKTTKVSLAATSTFSLSLEVDTPSVLLNTNATAIVQNFSGWRVLKVAAHIIPLSTTVGSSVFFFTDTEVTSAGAQFRSYRHTTYPNSNACTTGYYMNWAPRDYQSLDFHDSNTAAVPNLLNFYGYTNLTDLGTPSSTTDLWCISGTVTVQVRGLSV